jgi:hypothetical protein
VPYKPKPLFDRLHRRAVVGMECWGWDGALNTRGYATLRVNGRGVLAHRVSWQVHYGPVPPGLCVLHQCDNPTCTNPAHLFLGTKRDNTHDMLRKGRQGRGRAVLTAAQVERGRALRAEGMLMKDIAQILGVHTRTVGHFCTGKTWSTCR